MWTNSASSENAYHYSSSDPRFGGTTERYDGRYSLSNWKEAWRPWLEDCNDDADINEADEGDARKAPETMIHELVTFEDQL